jgi:hypothetical protein
VSVKRCTAKLAATDRAALIVTVQVVPETASHPLHPAKTDAIAGVGVSVTIVPLSYWAEQAEPQSIPAGVDVTVPLPAPFFATVSVKACRANAAWMVVFWVIVSMQVEPDTDSHPAVHPTNVQPALGLAVATSLLP